MKIAIKRLFTYFGARVFTFSVLSFRRSDLDNSDLIYLAFQVNKNKATLKKQERMFRKLHKKLTLIFENGKNVLNQL